MKLTAHQRDILRQAIPDDKAFQTVIDALDVQPVPDYVPTDTAFAPIVTRAIDDLPVSLYVKDRQSRFVMANRETVHALKQTDQEHVIGKTDFDFLYEADARYFFEQEQYLMRTGEAIINEESKVTLDVDTKWLLTTKHPIRDHDGEVIGLIGLNIDITRQKEAEQNLEAERNLLRTLINTLDEKIYIKDHNGQFIIVNNQVLEGAGIQNHDDIVGTTDFDYMSDDLAQKYFDDEQEIIRTGKPLFKLEALEPTTDDEPVQWWQLSKVPLYDDDGKIIGIVGINRDVTEQKHAQQREIDFELEQSRRQILSDFILGSSHEFRTPISAINSAVHLLSRVDDPDKRATYVEKIIRQTDTLTHLIDMMNQMLEFDRGIQLHSEQFTVGPFFDDLIKDFEPRTQTKHLTLTVDIDKTITTLYGDAYMLKRALSTILDNAVAYTEAGGTITLQATSNNNLVTILIQDTGIGMTPETQSRIFERFYRADKARSLSGFGLGLSIAKRIIDLHQGHITVTSEVDVGSEFVVTLPLWSSSDK